MGVDDFLRADGPPPAAAPAHTLTEARFLDRDRSILAFNDRVLDLALRTDYPLLERLRFLCIVSSNLDEFFEVRAAPHLRSGAGELDRLSQAAHELVERQYAAYNEQLKPALRKEGIAILSHGERNTAQRRWVRDYFDREVRPLLVPVSLDPAHPFPQVANKSLNFIVRLGGKDAFGRDNEIAIVKVPRVLPRLIRLPDTVAGKGAAFVTLSSVVRARLPALFGGRPVLEFAQFRVTRHSDLEVDEEEVDDLRSALRAGLQRRPYGEAVRLEVSYGCSDLLAAFLLTQFKLPAQCLYRVHGPVNLVRLQQLIDLVEAPKHLFPRYKPAAVRNAAVSVFDRLKHSDEIVHLPFASFDTVVDFLRQAVHDPHVVAIRQTIYRAGPDPAMLDLLREAVRRGKDVMVVVELKARFDEEANIGWTETLESIGAQVVYGVVGLKTHAKMLLVTRREGRTLRRYAHLSTGNYNVRTAQLYTDIGYLTADARLAGDVERVFVHLAGQNALPRMQRLWVAPFQLQRRLVEKLDALGQAAAQGTACRAVLKMNALTDEPLMQALLRAARRGVQADLIVRGACMLPAGVPGLSDNIRVRSVVGRFLEHSRVFYFQAGDSDEMYLSSADWMSRNMVRRVELAWPVLDAALRRRLYDDALAPYLDDQRDAWEMLPGGSYQPLRGAARRKGASAQEVLMARYGARKGSDA